MFNAPPPSQPLTQSDLSYQENHPGMRLLLVSILLLLLPFMYLEEET